MEKGQIFGILLQNCRNDKELALRVDKYSTECIVEALADFFKMPESDFELLPSSYNPPMDCLQFGITNPTRYFIDRFRDVLGREAEHLHFRSTLVVRVIRIQM